MEEKTPILPAPPRRVREVGAVVRARVERLLAELAAGRPAATADLARLRRGAGKAPGQMPDIWELTAPPQSTVYPDDNATPEEIAVHVAMTLFALHQQSEAKPMHDPQRSFAAAFGALVSKYKDAVGEKSLRARFDAVITATTFTSVPYHLRGLVALLKREGLSFDYGGLADDVCALARGMSGTGPHWAPRDIESVRRRWARDFRHLNNEKNTTKEK